MAKNETNPTGVIIGRIFMSIRFSSRQTARYQRFIFLSNLVVSASFSSSSLIP